MVLSPSGQATQCLAIMWGGSGMTPFDILVVRAGPGAVVQVCGELDLSTAPRLDEQLVSLAEEGVLDVTLDLTDLDFIDSTGLQALVCGLKRLRTQGGDLGLRSPKQSTRKVLEITGLTSVFRLEASLPAACDALGTSAANEALDVGQGGAW